MYIARTVEYQAVHIHVNTNKVKEGQKGVSNAIKEMVQLSSRTELRCCKAWPGLK